MCDCSGKVLLKKKKKKKKNLKCIISDLLRDISRIRHHAWDKESKILADK